MLLGVSLHRAELQALKRSLADAILQADANLLKDLTVDDLERLLS